MLIKGGVPARGIPVRGVPTRGIPMVFNVPVIPFYTPSLRPLPESEYVDIGKYVVDSWSFGEQFVLRVRDWKTRLEAETPSAVYQLGDLDEVNFTYPNLDPNEVGTPVPFALGGPVYDIPGVQIDTTTKTFKFLDGAVNQIIGFRANGGSFVPDSFDLAKTELTWAAWSGEQITIDIIADNSNPADAIEHLLTIRGGEAASELLTPTSAADPNYRKGFGQYGSRLNWISAHDRDGNEVNTPTLSIYVDSPTPVLDLVNDIAAVSFGRFFYHPAGYYYLDAWEPVPGRFATELTCFDFQPEESITHIITRVTANFREWVSSGLKQTIVAQNDPARGIHNLPIHYATTIDLPFPRREDVQWFASRNLAMEGKELFIGNAIVDQRGMKVIPGQQVRLVYPKRNTSGLFEVLKVHGAAGGNRVAIKVGNWRGFEDAPGFWTVDNPTFPDSLGGGSANTWDPSWTAAQKRYAIENYGYWTDDDGFLGTPKDVDSWKASVWA